MRRLNLKQKRQVEYFLSISDFKITQISPKCDSPHCPLVSGLAIMTLTPGRSFPDSTRQSELGAPRSTKATRLFRKARRSTYT